MKAAVNARRNQRQFIGGYVYEHLRSYSDDYDDHFRRLQPNDLKILGLTH